MKKILLTAIAIGSFAYADVSSTSVGCENKEDLINLSKKIELNKKNVNIDMNKLYKYMIEKNCEVINPKTKINQKGKPTKDGFLHVYVKEYDKYLYIYSDKVKNTYTPTNNKLNRSF